MLDFSIPQALFDGAVLRARSPDFTDEWVSEAERVIAAYGAPPAGVPCPEVVFALPFGPRHVLVGQVAGPPAYGTLRFRLLLVGKELYGHLHDPFRIAERFPAAWDARGELPALQWSADEGPHRRTVEQLADVLKQNDPFFLGAAQTLVDTGRLMLVAPEPQGKRLRDLWTLLPDSSRRSCWPATLAFSPDLGFDVLVLPAAPEPPLPGYLNEEQARDYPESRYERALQFAVETGDQATVDRLLARRSSAETLRLALYLVLGLTAVSLVMRIVLPAI